MRGLLVLAIAGVGSGVGHRFIALLAHMLRELNGQGSLDQPLGQLLEQATLTEQVFRLLVVGQQARQLFFGDFMFLGGHCVDGLWGPCPGGIVRLHKILHPLRRGDGCSPLCSLLNQCACAERIQDPNALAV